MSQVIGAPDWQRGVVKSEKLLATVPPGVSSESVTVPANVTRLIVLWQGSSGPPSAQVTGNTTGITYPGSRLQTFEVGFNSYFFEFTISTVLDDSFTIEVGGNVATNPWYVISASDTDVVNVPALAALVQIWNTPTNQQGINVLGYDGSDARFLSVDSNGRVIPLVPTASVDVTLTGASDPLLAAPASGRWYLFGFDVAVATGTAGVVTLSAGGVVIATAQVGTTVNLTDHLDLDGFATASAVTADGPANIVVTLRYAPGP